ncbi:MAG: hypothetical protein AB7P50_11160 [Alphaproteobacteria bacterium]
MAKTVQQPFKGDLMKPMARRRKSGLLNVWADEEVWKRELYRRWGLLFEHYGIDRKSEHATFELAVKLAVDFVPGMQEAKPERRGRPKSRTTPARRQFRGELLAEFDAAKERNPTLSEEAILRSLKSQWRRAGKSGPAGLSIRSLRHDLKAAREERHYAAMVAGLAMPGFGGSLFELGLVPRPIGPGTRLLMGQDELIEREKKA